MRSMTAAWKRGTVALFALIAVHAISLVATPDASGEEGMGFGKGPAAAYSTNCQPGGDHTLIDPVGVLFRGKQASPKKAKFETARLANWTYEGLGGQHLQVRLENKEYGCREVVVQPASEPDYRIVPPEIPEERFHMRLWFVPETLNNTWRKTVGTPHHEDFIEHDPTGLSDHCVSEAVDVEVAGIHLTPGTHAVDKGGGTTGEESGFDRARHALREAFERNPRDEMEFEDWGNDEVIEQCDGDKAGSDGHGIIIQMEEVSAGATDLALPRQRTALLRGRVETESPTEWWFEYGPSHAEGPDSYPHKTAVKSTSGAVEEDVSRGVVGLSPATPYFARIFTRNSEGEVEEGNEVKYETCGVEEADEDDNAAGPRPATPECSTAVDAFYRDVNGDLGHQSWSAGLGDWSTETRPASIPRTSIPRVVPRTDGSGDIDVFYRDSDNNLGHHFYTPGQGWTTETLTASMTSDPSVVEKSDGTIDVFFRTASNELGHRQWVPGGGWSVETRPATLSAAPHAVVAEDGSLDVVYRSGTDLGIDAWTAEGGWTHEVRSATLAAEPRPLVGEGGKLDVFYRTTSSALGHDWFVSGSGWSREIVSTSVASDPHVVRRPDGTIDVFYRTSGSELGHRWWTAEGGWMGEVRPGNISSDPHVVARADGSLEVFYRDHNQIGHQWYVPGTGWSTETRLGPIASQTDPHVVTQSNGRIDVLYQTPTEQLGRDWYVPGVGWSHELRPMRRPSRPVAEYSFDENTGTTVADLSGHANNGTVEGADWAPGRYGSALEFDGASTCVSVPDSESLQLREELTIETWVRPEGSFGDEPLVLKEVAEGEGPSYDLGIGITEGGWPEGWAEGGEVKGPEELERNVWTHLAYTYDGGRMRLFVNGEQVASKWVGAKTMESKGPLRIGCLPSHEYAEIRIDEVRLYDRALNATEIAADMEAPLQTPRQGPVAAWPFDEDAGATAEDSTGEGHEGMVEGATWEMGRYGDALAFDGAEDCVTVPASPGLELREEMTVEAWVKPEGTGEAESILFKEAEGGWFGYSLFLGLSLNGRIEGIIANDPETETAPTVYTPVVEPNVWTHVALTYDGKHERLYMDGELVDDKTTAPANANNGDLRIGCVQENEAGFDGRIDEVRLYERALGPVEIAGDMESPLQTAKAGPVADWSFDEGEGTVAYDYAGAHDATIEGADWAPGRYGSSLEIDGEGCATVTEVAGLLSTEEFTFESWLRYEGDGKGEANPFLTMEDVEPPAGAEPFAWVMLAGGEEVPKTWLRNGEDPGFEGIYGTAPLLRDVWTQVTLTDDGGTLRLYVNGELVRSVAAPDLTTASGPLQIGCGGGYHFEGRIDEVRIYDRVLAPGEVAAETL